MDERVKGEIWEGLAFEQVLGLQCLGFGAEVDPGCVYI